MRPRLAALIVCLTLGLSGVHARQNQLSVLTSSPFESYLESLRAQTGIPGMSAALVQDGQIVWERGFGFQNVEARVRATPDTPYPVADISQTLAAVLVLHCAEERRLSIDDPSGGYGGVGPGSGGDAATGPQSHLGRRGRELSLRAGALRAAHAGRRELRSAAVSQDRRGEPARTAGDEGLGPGTRPHRFQRPDASVCSRPRSSSGTSNVLERIAVPYKVDNKKRATRTEIAPEGINAATGLVTTVRDFARFDAAHRRGRAAARRHARGRLVARHDRLAHGAPHRARMVRPDLSRRTRRLALRAHRERLLVARRQAPVPPSDVHPVRQQRRPELDRSSSTPATSRAHSLPPCSCASTPRTPLRTPFRVLALLGVAPVQRPRDRARGVAPDAVSRPDLQGRHDAHRPRAGGGQDALDLRRFGRADGRSDRSASKAWSSIRPASSNRTTTAHRRRPATSSTAARWRSWATSF